MGQKLLGLCLLAGMTACAADAGKTGGAGILVGDVVDLNGDGVPDGVAVSSQANGTADSVDTNGDGAPDAALTNAVVVPGWPRVGAPVDVNHDGNPDGTAIDTDHNGIADAVDTNGDGNADLSLLPGAGAQADAGPGGNVGGGGFYGGSDAGLVITIGDAGPGSCASINEKAEITRGPVDIIIVLDTSGSMASYICNVSNNLTMFADGVGPNTHVITDYTMGTLGLETALLCGGADPLAATKLAMDPARYLNVPTNVDSWKALTDVNADFDKYKSFLRKDAPTHFVVVSDDESSTARGGMTASDFQTQMEMKLGHKFYFHSICADGVGSSCAGSNAGTQYRTLSDVTGGQKLSICASDWSTLFKQLQEAVVASAPLPCDFDIPPPPGGQNLDPAKVQVKFTPAGGAETEFPLATSSDKCGDKSGWYYDDPNSPKKVQFCPAACTEVKKGGSIGIAFGCAPSVVF